MKQKYLFILYLFFTFVQIFAQNTGDFRSIANGNWESASSWEFYNGSSWTAAGVFPGQSTGTYSVTISSGNTISITSNLTTAEMGSVIVNGTLDLNPPSPFNITLSTLHLFIDGGVLNFNGPQISLNLPLRASPNPSPYIEIKNGGTIGGSCTHKDEILIGNNVYAVCKTTGSSDYVTFGEIATSGGTINAVINLPPSNTTSCKDQPITLEGHYEGAAGSTVNYQWTATYPNGDPIIIPIATGTLSNNSDIASASLTPTIFGNYLISFTVSTDISGINFSNTVTNLVTIEDTQAPNINCPVATNANRNTNAALCTYTTVGTEFNATATDNCAVTSLTYSLSGATTGSGTSLAGVVFDKGVTTVTWSASDGVNTAVNCSFTVTVTDNQAPIINCPVATNANRNTNAALCTYTTVGTEFNATATDNCAVTSLTYSLSGATTGSGTSLAGVVFDKGVTTVTWSASDGVNTVVNCSFTVTVTDNQAPIINCPVATNANRNTNAALCTYTTVGTEFNATATDNCAVTSLNYTLSGDTTGSGTSLTGVVFNKGVTTVTWSASDGVNTVVNCSFTVTVTDNQAPIINCPVATNANRNTNAALCTYTAVGTEFNATATDNCAVTSLTYSLSGATTGSGTSLAGVVFDKGVTTVTWSASDGVNTAVNCSFTVTVTDNQAPIINCPVATNANRNTNAALCTYTTVGTEFNATATDNCAVTSLTYSLSGATTGSGTSLAGVVFDKGVTTVTWSASDGVNTAVNCSFTVTVSDNQAPSINCPVATNANRNTNATLCTYTAVGNEFNATATDNCAVTSLTYSLSGATTRSGTSLAGVAFNKGVTTVTWSASDGVNTAVNCSFTVTVTDNQAPSINCPVATNANRNTNAALCTYTTVGTEFNATATDNCAVTSLTYSLSGATTGSGTSLAGVVFDKGVTTVTWSASDGVNTAVNCSFTVTVTDNQAPIINCPVATNANRNTNAALCTYTAVGTEFNATATDNCAVTSLTYSLSGATTGSGTSLTGVVFNKGITTVTWSASDGVNTVVNCSFTVTVTDNQAPIISCPVATNANRNTNAALCTYTAVGTEFNATATDNCGVTSLTYALSGATTGSGTSLAGVVFNKGVTTVTWSASDGVNTAVNCSFTVTISDIEKPVLTPEANQDVTLNASCLVTIPNLVDGSTATDNCAGVTISQSPAAGTSQAAVHDGTINVTVTATDAAGNTDSKTVVLTAKDTTNPVLNTGINQSANTSAGVCTASVIVTNAVFSDNCSGATISYTLSGATTNTLTNGQVGTYTFNKGITTIDYTVTDAAGNTTTGSKTITVIDNIKPTITAPPTINTTTNTACTATGVSLGSPITSDNCAVASVTNNHPSTTYPLGNTTVVWTVTDTSGNTATANQIVRVTDNIPPTISCPANKTVNTSADGTGDCTTTVNVGTPITSDNCGISSVIARVSGVIINTNTYQFPTGNTTINWTVTDNAGLTASCDQIITVIDDENPTINCPADQNVFFNNNCQYSLQNYTSLATSSDNCDNNITITQSPAAGTLISAAQTTITLTATDDANKTSSCTFKVNATDNIPPTAVCKNYTAYLSSNGTINVAASNLNNGSSDNCGIANMTVTPNAFTCSNIGANNVVFTVYDNGGNSSSCNAVITVVDNTPPTVICKNFVVVVDAITRVATIKASDIDNGSNDACGIASMSVSPSQFADSPNIYTATTTLTVTDVNGNSSSCTATVTVEPPKNLNTYLTGVIVNPVPDNPQAPSALVEVTACPGGLTTPKDIQFTLQAIGTYNLQASQVLNWEYSNDNGETWITIPNTTGLLTYTLTGLTSDTFVRLRITDADDSSIIKTSAEAYARFLPPDEPPIIVSHSALDICLGDSVTINAESFYDQPAGQFGKGGKFNYAQPDGWRVDGLDGFFPASGNNNSEPTWKETNSNTNPNTTFSGINYDTSDNTKFAIAHAAEANKTTTLETPVFNTIGMTSSEAILSFYTAYYFCNGGSGKIELSFDKGNTYPVTLNTIQNDILTAGHTTGVHTYKGSGGSACTKQYLVADAFRYTSINLGAYTGLSGLRVKFTFNSGPSGGSCNGVSFPKHSSNNCTTNQTFNVGSGWAIDDVGFVFAQVDDELEWTDEDGNVIAKGTTATVTPVTPGIREYGVTTLVNGCRTDNDTGTNFINVNTSLAYAGEDYAPLASNCGENSIQLNAYDNTKTAVTNYNKGAWKANLYTVPDTASGDTDYPGTGITGSWSIISATSTSCGNSATFSNTTDPDAIFTADPGTYVLRWTLTNGCFDEKSITFIDCKSVDFDGNNDYVSFKDNYNLTGNFSIETWVKPNAVNGTRTVISRKDAGNNTKGYDLSIVNGQVQFNYHNASGANSITTGSYSISTGRWYHLAVTFDGATYKLYVDGLQLATKNGAAPAATDSTTEALLGAMDQVSTTIPVNYFYGWMDEVKIWNKALGVEQIRQMMNQEIDASGSDVGGVVIPLRISGTDNDSNGIEDNPLLWNDLAGYYRMNVNCGDLTAYKGVSGRLHNINSSEQQTAPIPYTSRVSNQTWDTDNTWTNYDVWDVPNSLGINNQPIDWNIVKTNHKITANSQDLILLGLIVMSNELIITNSGTQNETNPGHGLWITHYLKLDGKMDLVGESQLVQKRYNATQFSESNFEENSTGYIERDQQGKQNSFNYNYWSSPVSNRGAANNSSYSMATILRDGTDSANPKTITFGDGPYFADGPLTSPIKISNRWIWTYSSLTPDSNSNWDNYWQWQYKSSTGLINVADGFSMKGSGGTAPIDALQNYVYTGKPNSGTISKFIALDQTYLIGNPYPSALDADEFIKDNMKDCSGCRGTANTFGGAIYFWDHFGLSNNHILAQYEGGYATYTLTGGVAAVADDPLNVNNGATGSKIPQRYIPVGQGFFIDAPSGANVQGGTFIFKNSQRAFVREASGNSIFMKVTNEKNSIASKETVDKRMKIRLGFDSPIGSHRQILVGTDPNTSEQFDFGYDARMIDVKENDMFWELENQPLIIQGIPDFNSDKTIPLGIKITDNGESTIKIDALENIPNSLDIYLYDNVSKKYFDLRKDNFTISLPAGEYNKRFSVTFVNQTTSISETPVENGIIVYYTNENQLLNIKNYFNDVNIQSVSLFNILKQNINQWKISDGKQSSIQIPIKNLSSAVYLVQIQTDKGTFSRKIIIK